MRTPRGGEAEVDVIAALRRQLDERSAEVARLQELIDASKAMIRERDTRLDKLEALAKFHFGVAAFAALKERDARIEQLEHQLQEQREATQRWEEWAQSLASDLWRQTERIQSLEHEVDALGAQVGLAVGA